MQNTKFLTLEIINLDCQTDSESKIYISDLKIKLQVGFSRLEHNTFQTFYKFQGGGGAEKPIQMDLEPINPPT